AAAGITYQEGWILMTTTTVKVFIDMFIGVWALVLALVWAYGIRKDEGRTVSARDLWERFPKFVLGYFVTFAALLGLVVARPGLLDAAKLTTAESNVFRVLFFVMTFFTIGLTSNFAKLREEGIGRLALVYVVCLFGFIVWIGAAGPGASIGRRRRRLIGPPTAPPPPRCAIRPRVRAARNSPARREQAGDGPSSLHVPRRDEGARRMGPRLRRLNLRRLRARGVAAA